MLLTNSFQVLCIWFLTQRLNRAVQFFSLWTVRRLKEDGKFNFPQRNWMERERRLLWGKILFEYRIHERTFVVGYHSNLGISMLVTNSKKEVLVKYRGLILRVTWPALGSDDLNLDQSGTSIQILPEPKAGHVTRLFFF